LVKTRQPIAGSKTRRLAVPLKMLLIADPKGDLKGVHEEATQIRDYIERHGDFINASLRSENITPAFIKEKIRNFDLVHFAGHADYNLETPSESGWQLTNGSLQARDIIEMSKTAAMPALIFANACQSGRTEEWALHENFQNEIFGLANAFLLSGVKHYVGTFWEILDEPSSRFAMAFYTHLLSGLTIGEAIRLARMDLIKDYGEESIVWASYLLYGYPTFNYMAQIGIGKERDEEERPYVAEKPEAEVRAEGKVVEFPKKEVKAKKWAWLGVAAGVLLIAGILLFGYPGLLREGTDKYERAALTYYHEGNFEEALNACKILEDKNPQVSIVYVIQGNIFLRNGSLGEAKAIYQRGLQASKGTNIQKAEALIGLGRIASIERQPDEALRYYQQATEIAPASSKGYLSQALVLEGRGRYDEALNLLGKAQEQAPQDQLIASITKETREKVALANDKEKQQRIDQLVKELLETMKSPPRALPTDGWTSLPLTMWVMDFQARGYSLQEGEERLLVSGLMDNLLQHGRIQVVERALLDRLLEELKLGTSDLADRRTALSLGKILAARLMLPGQLIYSGPQTQVSMRVIETETGRIRAAVNEALGSSVPASILAEKLSTQLIGKLEELYPLRGKIAEVRDEEIKLNIGQNVGVREGGQFKVVDEDLILEVISTQNDISLAKIARGEGIPQKGMRVEAIKTQGK
jgi:tetratricopeptide (TPR) repeat protein